MILKPYFATLLTTSYLVLAATGCNHPAPAADCVPLTGNPFQGVSGPGQLSYAGPLMSDDGKSAFIPVIASPGDTKTHAILNLRYAEKGSWSTIKLDDVVDIASALQIYAIGDSRFVTSAVYVDKPFKSGGQAVPVYYYQLTANTFSEPNYFPGLGATSNYLLSTAVDRFSSKKAGFVTADLNAGTIDFFEGDPTQAVTPFSKERISIAGKDLDGTNFNYGYLSYDSTGNAWLVVSDLTNLGTTSGEIRVFRRTKVSGLWQELPKIPAKLDGFSNIYSAFLKDAGGERIWITWTEAQTNDVFGVFDMGINPVSLVQSDVHSLGTISDSVPAGSSTLPALSSLMGLTNSDSSLAYLGVSTWRANSRATARVVPESSGTLAATSTPPLPFSRSFPVIFLDTCSSEVKWLLNTASDVASSATVQSAGAF